MAGRASRQSAAPPLSPDRARDVLSTQRGAAQTLLARQGVEQGELDAWKQTTEAAIVAAFGDGSRNLEAFDHASPSYAPRAGESEAFWERYRRDELRAKAATLESCITQLELGLRSSQVKAPIGDASSHPYDAARRVLKMLHATFLHYGHLNWAVTPDASNAAQMGLDEAAARKALRLLATKGLAKYSGTDAFVITDDGVTTCDHPARLDIELPLAQRVDTDAESTSATWSEAVEIGDLDGLVENEQIRGIVIRDLAELQEAARRGLPKSTLLLAGSILEALLVDVLDRNRALASTFMKKRRFPDDASLSDLIGIAADETLLEPPRHLLTPTSAALAKAVTEHRDLIHPHAEARGRIVVDGATAKSIVHLLALVVRDLTEATARGDIDAYVNK